MTLSQLLLVLRARHKLILGILAATVGVVLLLSLILPKSYKATATLVLNYTGIDPVTGIAYPGQMMPSYLQTQVNIIKSRSAAIKVVKELKLAERPDLREKFESATEGRGNIDDWIGERLLKKLEVVPARDSNVVDLSYQARSPEEAAAVANAFAAAYQETSLQLKVAPARGAASYLNDQAKSLRESLEAAQKRLSAFQQEHGLSSADGRFDVESLRLTELSAQLVTVQGQLTDARSRQRNSKADNTASPDVLASPLIQNLRSQVAQAEARFAQTEARFTADHPSYLQARAELDRLRAALERNVNAATSGVASSASILQEREAALRNAVNEQKTKVLQLNQARDQLSLLAKEVESAQSAYDNATKRVNQTHLEGRFNQPDATVLNAAQPPFKASFPNLPINIGLALLAGLLLGLGAGLMAEMRDRRVRTAADLAEAMQLPVLGSIDWKLHRKTSARLPGAPTPQLLAHH